jgi:hypothetical protein
MSIAVTVEYQVLKKGNLWLVPEDAEKPTDNRCKIKMEENSNE